MNIEFWLIAADDVAKWDGWRALAALGTMAAVWVALKRDSTAERSAAIAKAHLIGAMISEANAALRELSEYQAARLSESDLYVYFLKYQKLGHLMTGCNAFFTGIKTTECPTIEVMTTLSVLRYVTDRGNKAITKAYSFIEEKVTPFQSPPSVEVEIQMLSLSIKDLKIEQEWVAGRHRKIGTQEGHRREIGRKLSSPRSQHLRALPSILWAIIKNSPIPKNRDNL